MNIVALTGRFTTDPELKTTQSGVSVTTFCLAVDRKYQPSGQEKKTDFINFIAWCNHAEFITKYFSKGSMIGIEGELQTRTYTDKNGNNRKAVEVVVSHVSFCGSKAGNGSTNNPSETENDPLAVVSENLNNTEFAEVTDDEDLPF